MKESERNRMLSAAFITALLLAALLPAFPAEAADVSAIGSVSIRTQSRLELWDSFSEDELVDREPEEGEVGVWTANDKYSVSGLKLVSGSTDSLKIGQTLKIQAELTVSDGTSGFKKGLTTSGIHVSGTGAKCTGVTGSGETITVSLELGAVKGQYTAPEDARWSDTAGLAQWSRSEDGSGHYSLQLKRGGSVVQSVSDVEGTHYDFYPYMTAAGNYTFAVRAVPFTVSQRQYGTSSEWKESNVFYLSADRVSKGQKAGGSSSGSPSGAGSAAAPASGGSGSSGGGASSSGGSAQNSGGNAASGANSTASQLSPDDVNRAGWILKNGSWYFRYPDGTYYTDTWALIENKWYSFDTNGVMRTGWFRSVSGWYYLAESGEMLSGWQNIGGKRYYLEEDPASPTFGRMQTGFIRTPDGRCYLLQEDGSAARGWARVGDHWSYFDPETCEMVKDAVRDTFYVDGAGAWKR